MSNHFADRLLDAIKAKGSPIAVGLDPIYSRLPEEIRGSKELNDEFDSESAVDAIFEFSTKVLRAVAPHVAAVKLNSAFFERYYWEGIEAYYSLIEEADDLGLEIIGDVKRADISHTALAYAQAHLSNPEFTNMEDIVAPDAITVNPYLGIEALTPFVDIAVEQGKGIFVLVRTSNPEAASIQDFTDAQGKKLHQQVAQQVESLAGQERLLGQSGYSCVGAVVGATDPQAAGQLREMMPHCLFLVPGYGTQGGTAEAVKACFKPDGTGAIINASRSIIYAYERPEYQHLADQWEDAVQQAVIDMKQQLNQALCL